MDTNTASLASIGIDIGKEVFHLVGFGTDGKIAFRRKIKRLALVETFQRLPRCIVDMEACLSAHFVSRARASLAMSRASWRPIASLIASMACWTAWHLHTPPMH